jgi:hypothetical protein
LFTDSCSLIYAKRNNKRSLMLNSALNLIENFINLDKKTEIYYVPGELNICADVFSRAVSENLNCLIPREHPISKKGAAVPPGPDNFSVDNEILFKFLCNPLKSEMQDPYDKRQRRLMELRSVQTWFDLIKDVSSEDRFCKTIECL